MKKTVQIFENFAEADRADDEFYASLTPEERLDILLDLISTYQKSLNETAQRFERVYRVTELSQS